MKRNLFRLLAIGYIFVLGNPPTASATHAVGPAPWNEGISIDAALSYSTFNTMELVYDDSIAPGYMLSELDWNADVVLAGASGSFRHQRWVASAGAWKSLDTLDGSMVDRDWLYPEIPDWSDESIGDASLDLTAFDVNAGYTILKRDTLALDLILGYRQDDLAWEDFGGTYIYSTYGFRDDIGMFGEETGITYDQNMKIPYVGIHAHAKLQNANLSGYAMFSPMAEVTAEDHHILRELHFVDTFPDADYVGAGIRIAWALTDSLQAGLALDYQNLEEVIGDDYIVEYGELYVDGAGTSMESTTASITVGYSF